MNHAKVRQNINSVMLNIKRHESARNFIKALMLTDMLCFFSLNNKLKIHADLRLSIFSIAEFI